MSLLPVTGLPVGGWTKDEIKLKMDELLDKMIQAAEYGERAVIEEEDSKLEIQNLQKTLKDSWVFLKGIYDQIPESGGDVVASVKPTRMKRKLRLDFQV